MANVKKIDFVRFGMYSTLFLSEDCSHSCCSSTLFLSEKPADRGGCLAYFDCDCRLQVDGSVSDPIDEGTLPGSIRSGILPSQSNPEEAGVCASRMEVDIWAVWELWELRTWD